MKKSKILILISITLVFGLLTAIVFLTVPKARLDSSTFWVAWSFALPWNFVAAIVLQLWTSGKKSDDIVQAPAAYALIFGFGAAYLILGAIFMYFSLKTLTLLIILELILTVAYAILAMFLLFSADYIKNAQKEKREKRLFIQMLSADIGDCIAKTQDEELRQMLSRFENDVRFSDPMSHASLAGMENELFTTVAAISAKLTAEDVEGAKTLVKLGQQQLESRNRRCLMLK